MAKRPKVPVFFKSTWTTSPGFGLGDGTIIAEGLAPDDGGDAVTVAPTPTIPATRDSGLNRPASENAWRGRPPEMRERAARGLGSPEALRGPELHPPVIRDIEQPADVVRGLGLDHLTAVRVVTMVYELQPDRHLAPDQHAMPEIGRLISLLRDENVQSDIRREITQRASIWLHRRREQDMGPSRQVRRPSDGRVLFPIAPAAR